MADLKRSEPHFESHDRTTHFARVVPFSTWIDEEGHLDNIPQTIVCGVLPRFAYESCIKSAILLRGGALKFTPVVDDDTTLHSVQADTVAFGPSVLTKCSICSYPYSPTRTPLAWLKRKRSTTNSDKEASYFIS